MLMTEPSLPIITEDELRRVAADINSTAAKVAQEVYLQRRRLIFQVLQDQTGIDYSEQIPAVRKGRPSKNART